MRNHHMLTLAYLLSIGCGKSHVRLTGTSLGEAIGLSQQAALAHLIRLEKDGMIERIISGRRYLVLVTDKGYDELSHFADTLSAVLQREPSSMRLFGTVASGVGQGASYLSLPGYVSRFQSLLGITPFPGTLNIRLDQASTLRVQNLSASGGVLIKSFTDGGRTYGWVRCYGAKLHPDIDCYMIRLERTRHAAKIVELVAPYNLRERAGIKDGSTVTVDVESKRSSI